MSKYSPQAVTLMADVGVSLLNALNNAAKDGRARVEISRSLGRREPAVLYVISGKKNLKLSTIADYAHAMGCYVKIDILPGRQLVVRRRIDFAAKPRVNLEGTLSTILRARFEKFEHQGATFSPGTIKRVLMAVAETGYEWTKIRDLCKLADCGQSTALSVIRKMESIGVLEVNTRPKRGSSALVARTRYLVRADVIRRRFSDDPQTCIDKEGEEAREDRRDSRGTDPSEEAA